MKIFLWLFLAVSLLLGGSVWYVVSTVYSSYRGDSSVVISIAEGSSLRLATDALCREEVLDMHPFIAYQIARYYSQSSKKVLQPGNITISPGTSSLEIIASLFRKRTFMLTIPEGMTLREIASLVHKKEICDSLHFITAATSPDFLATLQHRSYSLEGYLLPDTYEFFVGATPEDIISKTYRAGLSFWEKECLPLITDGRSRHAILTLASIVEGEAPIDDEKKRVAGVYTNRLRKGIKLEADPTVQYALGTRKKRLLYKDLEIASPYNTYRNHGLPPAPINSPGRAAIKAAIAPEKHNYFFFVARGDGSLRHVFTTTGEQHLKAVREYRRNIRSSQQ